MRVMVLLIILLASCTAPADLETGGTVAEVGLDEAIKSGTFKDITSVVYSRRGKIELEEYWGGTDAETLHDTRSATKSLVAMAMGAAIADGYIAGVDVEAFSFFSADVVDPDKQTVTVRDLLTMSSALDCNDNDRDSPGNEENMYPRRSWLQFATDIPLKHDYARNSAGYGPFSYCTAGSFLLGQIVQAAVGEPVDQYIATRLLTPLGITRVHWDRSPSGEIQTGGGTEFTSRDLLKLGELVRGQGVYKGQKLLPAEWVQEMLRVHVSANEEQDYGYQWWRRNFRCRESVTSGWYMAGNGGNKVVIFDELDMTVVVTATHYGRRGMHQQTTRLIEDYVLTEASACGEA